MSPGFFGYFAPDANIEPFGFVALPANQVMVVLVRSCQLEELGAIFKRHALEHAQALECFEVTIDSD
jgi:hypothetical protein